ncbi:MAG: hypothetical protein JST20_00680 [Bacteroidetes bacterium]|nr:hypothetical protein [Bacteroidota bacterium]
MNSILLHSIRISKIAVAVLVCISFLLGQWVEVWHHHTAVSSQSKTQSVAQTAKAGEFTSHDSCPICSGSQFLKDGLMKPVSEFFSSVTKSVFTFFKHICYQFLAKVLHSGRAPPTL